MDDASGWESDERAVNVLRGLSCACIAAVWILWVVVSWVYLGLRRHPFIAAREPWWVVGGTGTFALSGTSDLLERFVLRTTAQQSEQGRALDFVIATSLLGSVGLYCGRVLWLAHRYDRQCQIEERGVVRVSRDTAAIASVTNRVETRWSWMLRTVLSRWAWLLMIVYVFAFPAGRLATVERGAGGGTLYGWVWAGLLLPPLLAMTYPTFRFRALDDRVLRIRQELAMNLGAAIGVAVVGGLFSMSMAFALAVLSVLFGLVSFVFLLTTVCIWPIYRCSAVTSLSGTKDSRIVVVAVATPPPTRLVRWSTEMKPPHAETRSPVLGGGVALSSFTAGVRHNPVHTVHVSPAAVGTTHHLSTLPACLIPSPGSHGATLAATPSNRLAATRTTTPVSAQALHVGAPDCSHRDEKTEPGLATHSASRSAAPRPSLPLAAAATAASSTTTPASEVGPARYGLDIEAVFHDPALMRAFREHLKHEFSGEGLDFLVAVRTFHDAPSLDLMERIYRTYIAPGSFAEVNLSDSMRSAIRVSYERCALPPPGSVPTFLPALVFAPAEREIQQLLGHDSWIRFLGTQMTSTAPAATRVR